MLADNLPVRTSDGVIFVPASIRRLSTYVLLEQEDWFEKEIGFVRRLLKPGMRAVDIGANFGIYTLAMARAVGPRGMVWAFEPAPPVADDLRRSLTQNELANVRLRAVALSNRTGTAPFRIEDNSELSRLAESASVSRTEVAVSTLDHEADLLGWEAIDFVKVDAEGEEVRIIEGGARFFATQTPVVMFELKHGAAPDLARPQAFAARGYGVYRLLGDGSFLVPFDATTVDDFELNLFACTQARAAELAQHGLLVTETAAMGDVAGMSAAAIAGQAFGAAFGALAPRDPAYGDALDAYALWRDTTRSPATRYGALGASLAALRVAAGDRVTRLSTFARAAFEGGARRDAIDALWRILLQLQTGPPVLDEPFWPASARFDRLPPEVNPAEWFLAAVVEAFERTRSFSGYFSPSPVTSLLEWLCASPWASAAMERRRQLEALRSGRQRAPRAVPAIACRTPDNLNPELWAGTNNLGLGLGVGSPER